MKYLELYHKGFYEAPPEDIKNILLNVRSTLPALIDNDNKIYYNADFFLHGICHIFAFALHQRFGYDIYSFKNKSETFVHWCCISYVDNYPVYIDVRGITNSYEEFLSEFQPDLTLTPIKQKIDNIDDYDDEWDETQIKFANELIDTYYDYYILQ